MLCEESAPVRWVTTVTLRENPYLRTGVGEDRAKTPINRLQCRSLSGASRLIDRSEPSNWRNWGIRLEAGEYGCREKPSGHGTLHGRSYRNLQHPTSHLFILAILQAGGTPSYTYLLTLVPKTPATTAPVASSTIFFSLILT